MLFEFLEIIIAFFGHTVMHKPQPLHRSVSIMIFPAILVLLKSYSNHSLTGELMLTACILTCSNISVKAKRL